MNIIKGKNSAAKINPNGAELKSFCVNGEEIIWQTNPDVWKGSAPVLFPFIGRLKGQKYIYKGKTYQIDKHGFARQQIFKIERQTENKISYVIEATEETKKVYPFDFVLRIIFSIENDILKVKYEIENRGKEDMLFCIGSHPAISLPMKNTKLTDYYVEFEEKEILHKYELIEGLVKKQPKPYLNNESIIKLHEHIFDNDAIIFTNIKSKSLFIKNDKTGKTVKVNLGAPDIGIWAKPNADYVCIEPWFGYDDPVDSSNKLEEKPGIQVLKYGKTFTTEYSIEKL